MREYKYSVETKENGQRRKYEDSYYHFLVISDRQEAEVKLFCMHVLRKAYKKEEMPNPFAGELVEFKKITDNAKGLTFPPEGTLETYSYKTREEYAG